MNTVPASIPVLRWAAQRANLSEAILEKHYKKWELWLREEAQPTLRQLEDFANRTRTPFGYFFLKAPPEIVLPIPDYRTVGDRIIGEPSSELLDVIYQCQQRQDWFRDYAQLHALPKIEFVGSVSMREAPETTAKKIRDLLDLSSLDRRQLPGWKEALRRMVLQAEDAGILVMTSSIVGSNTKRKLAVGEFRGFTLADEYAPLVFINADDSKAAQMFTLIHEIAHLWLGESGISDSEAMRIPEVGTERWCNQVAAETLLPMEELRHEYTSSTPLATELQRLARTFKVSTLVVLRRLFDAGYIDRETLRQSYKEEVQRIQEIDQGGSDGGDFYRTLGVRTGKRFARAVLSSTLEGQTLFQDAFRMLGIRKNATFYQAARELGVVT